MQQIVLNHRYELGNKIGEGGMAVVYSARDLKLNRRVAVKILHSRYVDDPDFLSRFQHEAQAAAVLSHPSVVNVYDVGQDGPYHYIVMEYVDGENLKTRINREAPLSVGQSVAIAEAVAYGLDSAHRLGMVHRDIKPQNIMITHDGHVRIADFGIAKSEFSSALTQTGVTFGTADYISPEQAQGKGATPQSDLYSLGVTLYEMLSGRLPFVGDTAVSVAMQHVGTQPPSLREQNPHVPIQLEALIMQVMAKDPAQRPASAREFAQLLAQYRDQAAQQTAYMAMPIELATAEDQVRVTTTSTGPAPVVGRGGFPPPRPPVAKSPQSQSQGCGVFIVGLLVLVGVLSLVVIFGGGLLDARIGISPPSSPTPLDLVAILETSELPTPTITPSPSPTTGRTPTIVLEPTSATPSPSALPTPSASPSVSPTPSVEPSPTPDPLVLVPDLRGLPEVNARSALGELRLVPIPGESQYDDEIPEGSVIDQEVPPGTELRQGERVTYTLSLGPPLVNVPNLVQTNINYARGEAERLGLRVEVVQEPSSSVSENFIIRQEPLPGARLEEGETILLIVSVGDKIRFPNVIGLLRGEAEQLLAVNGITLNYVDEQGPDRLPNFGLYRPGEVVSAALIDGAGNSQPIDNGAFISRNSQVILGVRAP